LQPFDEERAVAKSRPRLGPGRRLIGWIAAYAFILQAVFAGMVATQAAATGTAAHSYELCLTGPDGAALPGHTQHESCAIHCAVAGALPVLVLALVALLFPLRRRQQFALLFAAGSFDLLRRAGLGSRAPPLTA
jgi:hypothetical protein